MRLHFETRELAERFKEIIDAQYLKDAGKVWDTEVVFDSLDFQGRIDMHRFRSIFLAGVDGGRRH